MKNSLKIIIHRAAMLCLSLVVIGLIYGCVEENLPGAGSLPDDTPPEANFSYASDAEDFRIINFTNLSAEALTFLWNFGGENTSTDLDPTFTFAEEGTYAVSLIATDGLEVSDTITIEVIVAEGPYQPIVLEPGFENDGETGDARDPWDAEFSTVIQISSSPVASGAKAGKLPSDGARVAYQEILVEAESNYDVGFIYTLTNAVPGTLTVDILDVDANGGTFMSYDDTRDHVIGSVTLNDQDDPEVYVGAEVSFASGTSTLIAIMVSNTEGIEARFDDFEIRIGSAGAVPPSAAFTLEQSEANFLEYTFTNGSLNAATYLWDFGNGNTSMEESPVHVYETAGTYTVSLTATSEGGLTGEFSQAFEIHDPVTSAFSYTAGGDQYTFNFTDESINAVSVMWDFGDGFQATVEDPTHIYSKGGLYTVTLTATSSTGFTNESTELLSIGVPVIVNGDFSHPDGRDTNWKHGGWDVVSASTSAFNGSSDGSPLNYDGTESGSTKTDGAKYTSGTTANADGSPHASGNTRYAYQAVTLEANTEYYIEFAHTVTTEGDRVVMEILDAQFPGDADGALTAPRLHTSVGGNVNGGKGNFTVVQEKFTTGSNTDVAIWLWSNTSSDAWFDNIKILPAWLVEAD